VASGDGGGGGERSSSSLDLLSFDESLLVAAFILQWGLAGERLRWLVRILTQEGERFTIS